MMLDMMGSACLLYPVLPCPFFSFSFVVHMYRRRSRFRCAQAKRHVFFVPSVFLLGDRRRSFSLYLILSFLSTDLREMQGLNIFSARFFSNKSPLLVLPIWSFLPSFMFDS